MKGVKTIVKAVSPGGSLTAPGRPCRHHWRGWNACSGWGSGCGRGWGLATCRGGMAGGAKQSMMLAEQLTKNGCAINREPAGGQRQQALDRELDSLHAQASAAGRFSFIGEWEGPQQRQRARQAGRRSGRCLPALRMSSELIPADPWQHMREQHSVLSLTTTDTPDLM